MLSLFFDIQSLSKLMKIVDRVRPYLSKYYQMGMYTVHTDSLVVVPQNCSSPWIHHFLKDIRRFPSL